MARMRILTASEQDAFDQPPVFDHRENLLRLIAAHSPMSWAHINMLGEYDFSEEKLRDTLGILPPKKAA